MSSQDPPDNRGNDGARQTKKSNLQLAKDLFKRRPSPRPPARTPEHSSTSSLRSQFRSLFGRSTSSFITPAPPESGGPVDTSGPSTQAVVLNPQVNTAPKPEKPSDVTRNRLTSALRALESSVELFPPLKSAAGAFIGCLDTIQIAESNRADYEELANDFQSLADILKQYSYELKSESNTGSIAYIAQGIQSQVADIKKQNERGTIGRLLDATQDQEDIIRRYRHVDRLFRQLQCDLTMRTKDKVEKHLETTLLRGMSPVDDAKYNSSYSTTIRRRGCTPETREAIHQTLQHWTTDPAKEKIYWMNGMAGTGKTTIAYSFCEWLKTTNRLGASFFCSRISSTCRSLNQIVPTIAYQLARFSPAFRSTLCAALNDNPDAGKLNVMQQFEELINRPMLNAKDAMPDNVVVVVDALDECDDTYSVRLLLDVLLKFAEQLPLKFFVASRPEHAIRDRMMSEEGAARAMVHLHDIEKSIVEEDIKKYLTESLGSMVPPPPAEQIELLAKRSRNLFIYAATVVRYIYPEDMLVNSSARLESILATISDPKATTGNKYEDLDRLYTTVLSSVFNVRLEPGEKEGVQSVLWTIVCAKEPITMTTIASLSSLDESQVWVALQSLRSVIHVPENNTLISTLHASFPEYMLDRSRSGEFWCDEPLSNERMVHRLFDIMRSELRFNICNLENSYLTDDQAQDLDTRVAQFISPTLSYACRYWSGHLILVSASANIRDMLLDFLSDCLLFWMEVLSLCRCIGTGAPMIQQAQTWLGRLVDTLDETQKWMSDSRNFVTWFAANPCSRSTPHIYISALPLCSKSNWVYQHYWSRMQGLATATIRLHDESMLAVWNTNSRVFSVSISPDGNRIASGHDDGSIHVYDLHTGAIVLGPLKAHESFVFSVRFSPDGTHIASGSHDQTVIIWDARTGSIVTGPLHGHTEAVWSVAFLPDGNRIVSGSRDKTIIVWVRDTGVIVLGPLSGHSDSILSVACSPDGRVVASGSADRTIRLWDAQTGAAVTAPLQGHTSEVTGVAFSPHGNNLVSCSYDKSIRVWDTQSGTQIGLPFAGHKDRIWSIACSSDGTLVSGGGDGSIMVWDMHTGRAINGPFRGHTTGARSVMFSPDNTRVVSCADDITIRIWNVEPKDQSSGQKTAREVPVGPLAFSPDRTRFISNSSTGTLRIWDLHTGAPTSQSLSSQTELESIYSVAFSSRASYVASSGIDFTIRVWDVLTGEMIHQPLVGHKGPVRCLAFSPDDAFICSGSDDCTVIVWGIEAGIMIGLPYEGHTGSICSVAYSPDGTRTASGGVDHSVRVWDPATGTLIHTLSDHRGSVESVAFSPDGRHIVSGDRQCIRRWDLDAPSNPETEYCWDVVKCVAFSSGGSRVIAGFGHKIRVFNTQFEQLSELEIPEDEKIHWVYISPDGTNIISASASINKDTQQTTKETDQRPPQLPNIIRVWRADNSLKKPDSISDSNSWSYEADGRILSPYGFALWVSPDIIRYMGKSSNSYRSSFVLSPYGIIDLRLEDLCIGDRWTECYIHKDHVSQLS